MKPKHNNDKRMEAAREATSQGTSSPSQSPELQAEKQLISMPQEQRETIEQVAEALRDIDLWGLPECPTGDTIRGLVWALEYTISPIVEPRCQHHVRFNLSISKEEQALGQAAINEVWQISATLLIGLRFLQTRGYVSEWGAECPASWSPGDFYNAIEDARDALGRLAALTDKLYNLFSNDGLPVTPFRTDDFDMITRPKAPPSAGQKP